jgi:hypothetical protein
MQGMQSDKKKTIGISVFAWILFISCFLFFPKPHYPFVLMDLGKMALTVVAMVIAGGLIQCRKWARVGIIILSAVWIVLSIAMYLEFRIDGKVKNQTAQYIADSYYRGAIAGSKGKKALSKSDLERIRKDGKMFGERFASAGILSMSVWYFIWNGLLIVYFTRPKVKEQFK